MLAKIWAFLLPILKNPGTWTTILGIVGVFFGKPYLTPAPTVSLPATAQVKPMGILQLPAKHTGSSIDWDHDAPDATVLGPFPDGSIAMQFPTAGHYRVHAHVARAGKLAHAHTLVTVGDSPTPPGPTPPGPTPPGPGPGPNPPGPTDPFVKGLQDAYTSEADPNKAQHVQFLAGIYKGFAASTPGDNTLHTLADLFGKLKSAVEAPGVGLAKTDLLKVRAYLGNDMNSAIGTTANTPLDAVLRQKAASEFSKISSALAEVH